MINSLPSDSQSRLECLQCSGFVSVYVW